MNSKKGIIKSSISLSFTIIAGMSTIAGLWGYTLKDINDNLNWWQCGIILFVCFFAIAFVIFIIKLSLAHREYSTKINGKRVDIKIGDIFEESGLKVIPFNENFDTIVDDKIISHNSLNGQLIDKHIKNIDELNKVIADTKSNELSKKNKKFELGKIIPYNDYLLLSLSHFDSENRAYINGGEYETMLIRMWNELRRTYAGKPISIPLLGGGITTIEGIGYKNYTNLLKCILCTLKTSKFQPENGITIVLAKSMIKEIDMNKIKEEF